MKKGKGSSPRKLAEQWEKELFTGIITYLREKNELERLKLKFKGEKK